MSFFGFQFLLDLIKSQTSSIIDWLQKNRTSIRVAFILRLVAMAAGTVLSLLWYRLLLRAMGDSLNGLFLSFLAISRLGGMGDFGIGGAVAIKSGMLMGRGEMEELKKLLASARSLFLFLAAVAFVGFTILSPWLPQWFHFKEVPGAGPLPLLFVWAGVTAAVMILAGYFHNLNYANGTVTWPILPGVVIGQTLAPLAHWELARLHQPLWVQNLPYVASTICLAWLARQMLKWSHPWLWKWRPLHLDIKAWKVLTLTSGWVYLCSICNAIYVNTDGLVINGGFGPELVPTYMANYKPCALVVTLILSASFVSLPKITQWISSTLPADRQRLLIETQRLNTFQIVLGCGAALGYLLLINTFIRLWLGNAYQCPISWQMAFACNLAVITAGDTGIQIISRCGDNGIKKMGFVAGITALLNLGFALFFMRLGSIAGIAFAAVIAQSVLSVVLGSMTCRHLGLSVIRWTLKSWLLPLMVILVAAGLKYLFPSQSALHLGILALCYSGLLIATALFAGLNKEMLRTEWVTLRGMLKI